VCWSTSKRRQRGKEALESCRLPRGETRTALLELVDHTMEIGIAGAKAPCDPILTSPGNPLAVREHLELSRLTRDQDAFQVQAFLDEGRETRDLDFVVLSRRAMNDFDLHSILQSASHKSDVRVTSARLSVRSPKPLACYSASEKYVERHRTVTRAVSQAWAPGFLPMPQIHPLPRSSIT
jgi:hypothetical protein